MINFYVITPLLLFWLSVMVRQGWWWLFDAITFAHTRRNRSQYRRNKIGLYCCSHLPQTIDNEGDRRDRLCHFATHL
ncbi:MAG: hypothetical protein AB4426_15005 [Xenococcaceae cyanobacterium]